MSDQQWWQRDFYGFDVETTGLDVFNDRFVTATLTRFDVANKTTHPRTWVIDPGIEVPEGAAKIHGYSTERVRAEGMPAAQGVGEVFAAVSEVFADPERPALAIYNAPFDLSMLAAEVHRHEGWDLVVPEVIVDPLALDKQVNRKVWGKGGRKLVATCKRYDIELSEEDAHTSNGDVLATGRLAFKMVNWHPELAALSLAELHRAQVGWYREQTLSFADWKRGRGEVKAAAEIASEADGWPRRLLPRGDAKVCPR